MKIGKLFLIWTCVFVTIVSVLGLNDRLNYEGLTEAAGMVKGATDFVKSETSFLKIVSTCTEKYTPETFQSFLLTPVKDIENEDGTVTEVSNTYVVLLADGALGFPGTNAEIIVDPVFIAPEDVPKVETMLFYLSHSSATKLNVIFAVNMMCFYVSAIACLFFDTLPILFELIHAVLYLLGFF